VNKLSLTFILFLSVGACMPAAAVITGPLSPDSLAVDIGFWEEQAAGAATSYMVGMTLLSEGDAAGAVPFLAHAFRHAPGDPQFSVAYRDVLIQLGYLRDALSVSQGIVQNRPESFDAWRQHIAIFTGLERYGEALHALDACRVAHPDSQQLDLVRAEILFRAQEWDQSVAAFEQALPGNPQHSERILGALAELASLRNQPEEARRAWHRALAAHPESTPLRLGAIRQSVANGADTAAFRLAATGDSLEALVAEPSAAATTWLNLAAGMIADAGRPEIPVATLSRRLTEGSLDLETALTLGRLHARANDWPAAIADMDRAAALWPDAALPRMFRGEFLAGAGRFDEAEQELRAALALEPSQPDFILSLISLLGRRSPELLDPARSDLDADPRRRELNSLADRAAAGLTDTGGPATLMMMGATFHGLGRPAEAAPYYERVAEAPTFRREALLNLSLAYEASNRPEQALSALELLHADLPDDPVVLNGLGYTLAVMGRDLERAETLVLQALRTDPENPAYLDSLGWVFFRSGRFEEAFEYLVRAANSMPEDPVILEHLGLALLEMGRHDRAYEVLLRARALGGDSETLLTVLEELAPVEP
jgi:tetratricopeptide (TPR) repeat protein